MNVIKRMPVPIYKATCPECKSEIEYRASEVSFCHIGCPVCGTSVWASVIEPVRMEDGKATCETCIHYSPSSCDGKPCTQCDPDNVYLNCYQRAETVETDNHKLCPWCNGRSLEWTAWSIVDDDFGQPLHRSLIHYCFSCGRNLDEKLEVDNGK